MDTLNFSYVEEVKAVSHEWIEYVRKRSNFFNYIGTVAFLVIDGLLYSTHFIEKRYLICCVVNL